jgi:hypothetical protein
MTLGTGSVNVMSLCVGLIRGTYTDLPPYFISRYTTECRLCRFQEWGGSNERGGLFLSAAPTPSHISSSPLIPPTTYITYTDPYRTGTYVPATYTSDVHGRPPSFTERGTTVEQEMTRSLTAMEMERSGQPRGKVGLRVLKRRAGRGQETLRLVVMTETAWRALHSPEALGGGPVV